MTTRVDTADEMEVEIDGAQLSPENLAKNIAAGGIPKTFRQQADIEAFYRFVHENDLREEAVTILDQVRQEKSLLKATKARVKH